MNWGLRGDFPPHVIYLDKLFYEIGKQLYNFELQQQKRGGFFSKRRKYSDVGFSKNMWLIGANARTILGNELCLDFDPPFEHLETAVAQLKNKWDTVNVFDSGSRGVHIHVFDKRIEKMSYDYREELRQYWIKKYGADAQKSSERTTIALEYAPHWKTGRLKLPWKK